MVTEIRGHFPYFVNTWLLLVYVSTLSHRNCCKGFQSLITDSITQNHTHSPQPMRDYAVPAGSRQKRAKPSASKGNYSPFSAGAILSQPERAPITLARPNSYRLCREYLPSSLCFLHHMHTHTHTHTRWESCRVWRCKCELRETTWVF